MSNAAVENAEQDLMQVPEGHLVEKNDSFQIHVAVPGFDEKGVKVTALPDAFIVSGEKRMFRRFELPSLINTDKIYAKLENGFKTYGT